MIKIQLFDIKSAFLIEIVAVFVKKALKIELLPTCVVFSVFH